MTESRTPALTPGERIRQLADARNKILSEPSDKAMAAILDHPQPAAVVHSIPEEDLHFLIHDIGLDDALPLISLASNRQWEFFLDMETWHRDQLNFQEATKWLQLLLQADPDRLANWCFDEKLEYIEFYLFRNIELCIRESDQDPSDFGNGFFSDDDTYYVRPVDFPVSTPEGKSLKERRDEMLSKLLSRLSHFDHLRYQGLLVEAASVLPGEIEEELFRLRNVRLAEKGFLPFDEAIGVYQPLRVEDLAARGKKAILPPSPGETSFPAPQFAAGFLEEDNLFVRGLKRVLEPHVVHLLQTEFASLCNQVISADQAVIRSRDQLRTVVSKVSSYLGIGLEQVTRQETNNRETRSSTLLHRHLLADIFRIGFGQALGLKWKASRWQKKSWAQARKLGLPFWDEAWLGLLGGLLIETPKYYDPSGNPTKYRDFQTLDEIDSTDRNLDRIMAMDRVLAAINPLFETKTGFGLLTYKNLILTLWARSALNLPHLGAEASSIAVPLSAFRGFFEALWTDKNGRPCIGDEKKTEFLTWLAKDSKKSPEVLSKKLGIVFENLFNEIESELAPVKAGNLDPRSIHLFLLET